MITILEGAMSSGKTHIANEKAIKHIMENYTGEGLIVFIGKTIGTLVTNVLTPIQHKLGQDVFKFSEKSQKATFLGQQIELRGCNDGSSEGKIRGGTFEFVYGDELTLWNLEYFERCIGNLRTPNACGIFTTNPDRQNHWVKTNYIDRKEELEIAHYHFLMDDNPSSTEKYKESQRKLHAGVFYKRMILGQWINAEGAIYTIFSDNHDKYVQPFVTPLTYQTSQFEGHKPTGFIEIGVDFGGNKSAHTFVATYMSSSFQYVHILESERHSLKLNSRELCELYVSFVNKIKTLYGTPARCNADSMESVLIADLREASIKNGLMIPVEPSEKRRIKDRIDTTGALFAQNRLFIQPQCKTLIDALDNAVWDDKKSLDIRLDDGTSDIDTLDAFEYSWEKHIAKLIAAARLTA